MAAVTSLLTLDYVAKILDENVELLEAIVSNDDNLTYGAIVSVNVCGARRFDIPAAGPISEWITQL